MALRASSHDPWFSVLRRLGRPSNLDYCWPPTLAERFVMIQLCSTAYAMTSAFYSGLRSGRERLSTLLSPYLLDVVIGFLVSFLVIEISHVK